MGATGQAPSRISPWWKADLDEATQVRWLFDTVSYLEKEQQPRRQRNLICLRLYGNLDYVGFGPFQYTRTNAEALPENRVKLNVIGSMVDTVAAKISKMAPKVSVLTSGGDFQVQSQSRYLQKFIGGVFYENKVHPLHRGMFKDSLVFDIGILKHFIRNRRIVTERVLPTEFYVDTADAMYGDPCAVYHVKYVSKEQLMNEYPEKEAGILMSAGSFNVARNMVSLDEEREFCIVVEAWHKDTGDGDGIHTICTDKVQLIKEPYKKDYFPFTFQRWTKPLVGFYGQSLADRLMGNQIEINKMLRIIQRSFHLGSAFKVFLEYGSRVSKDHLNNDIGSIIYFSGQPPIFTAPQVVHPEYFRHLEWLVKSCYEEAGVSQLSASSKMPEGIDQGSGKALREYNDIETERFVLQGQEHEASYLRTAEIYVDLARDIKNYPVVAESKRFVEEINFRDIKLKDNEFIMQMFPTSMLPQTPTGRLAYVRELMQDGFVDQNFALSLLEFPDIEGYVGLKTAPLDDIMYTLERILYHGEFLTPEPFQNLELGLSIFQNAYLKARKDKVPDDRLELLRRWITSAQAMKDQQVTPPPQQPMIPAGEQLRAKGQLPNPQGPLAGGASNPLVPQTGAAPPTAA